MGPARITLDTRPLHLPASGIGQYVLGLIRGLAALEDDNRYLLWGAAVEPPDERFSVREFGGRRRWLSEVYWKRLSVPPVDLIAPATNLWHFTNYVGLPTRRPYVVTVCDLGYLYHPEFVQPDHLAFLRRFFPDTVRRAERVVAISETTKAGLMEEFELADERVAVTPLACHPEFFARANADEVDAVKRKHGISGPYLLAVGTLEPRKNLGTLLSAFAGVASDYDASLVVAGGKGWLFEETMSLLDSLDIADRVILTGYVPQDEMPALYQGAEVFVFPSRYEGFGIPVLEAMASGTPVACSATSSLPEVAGDAAAYFPARDPAAMEETLRRLLASDAERERLVAAGRAHVSSFSWERTARATLDVYRQALEPEAALWR